MNKALWEILVPVCWPGAGDVIPMTVHQQWDKHCRAISGGMTILRSAMGEWQDGDKIERERMIPVRFLATRMDAIKLTEFTQAYYSQKAVMCYKISDEIIGLVSQEPTKFNQEYDSWWHGGR